MQVLKELVAMEPLIRAQLGENTFSVTLHAITSALRKVSARMLTYAHVCLRMLTYAQVR